MLSLKKQDQNLERQYPVPANMISILPQKLNPLHGVEPMAGAAHRWSMETSLFTKSRYGRLGCVDKMYAYMYPLCADPDRFDTMRKLFINYFILDDHLECPYGDCDRRLPEVDAIFGQMHAVCDKLSAAFDGTGQHVSAHHWKPYVLAAYALYDTVCAAYNDIQKRRFIQLTRDWTDGNIAESYDLHRKRQFTKIEEFYEVRDKSSAVMMTFQLIEYTSNVYVPEPEWRNPVFQQLMLQLSRLIVICNDLYSFEKEVLDAGSPHGVYNCVTALAQIDNISVTESMNRWVIKYMEMERTALALANELTMADWLSPDTRIFIDHVLHFVGGHWKISTMLDRYHTMLDLKEFE